MLLKRFYMMYFVEKYEQKYNVVSLSGQRRSSASFDRMVAGIATERIQILGTQSRAYRPLERTP